MNTLLLASEFPPANYTGLATYSYNIAKHLSKNNNVIVSKLPAYSTIERYALGLQFVYNLKKRINELKKNEKIDLVYGIPFRPEFSAIGLYAKALNLPLVSHEVGSEIYSPHPLFILAKKIAYSISDQLICGTNFQKEMMLSQGAPREKVHVVLGGVDTQIFRPLYNERYEFRKSLKLEEKFVLLSLGRLIIRKGFDDAIKALAFLEDIDELILLIVGKGPEIQSLRKLVKVLSLDEKVIFLGRVSSNCIPQIYNIADLFIAPFRMIGRDIEGFPLVVQEAQACGIPVISTNTPGPPELVENGRTGFIVEMNSPRKIAEKVRVLYEDERIRRDMARSARKRAEKLLDWEVVATKIENVLRVALKQGINSSGTSDL